MVVADFVSFFLMCFLFIVTVFSLGFGFFQKWRYKKERDKKVDVLLSEAERISREKTSNKSIDDLVDENNKRFGPAMGNDPEDK